MSTGGGRNRRRVRRIVLVLCTAAAVCSASLQGCSHSHNPAGPSSPSLPTSYLVSPYPWPTASPSEVGLDSARLTQAATEAESWSFTLSLLVVRRGLLAFERYFNGAGPNMAFHIHSASKSVTSALVGIAWDLGVLGDLDRRMLSYFPEYTTPDLDPRKSSITLRHLLTMRGGFAWSEDESSWNQYARSGDWVAYAIRLPLADDPGTRFNYCSPGTNLLAAILARAAGSTARQFADTHLFGPLGITIGHWHRDPQGNYTGGHEMYFAPRDMARFGQLYLEGGSIGGQRIVSAQWVAESLRPTGFSGWAWGAMHERGYGYQWWLGSLAGHDVLLAAGKGGQLILCVPDLEMVVVTTNNGDSWVGDWAQVQRLLDLLARHVIPAAS